jgi:SET domain-containing protein
MPEVAVRESRIAGLGVFTLDRVRAGRVVREFELERQISPESPLRPERGERAEHCTLVDGCFFLVGSPDRYFNHSCDPNVYLRFGSDRIEVVARRDIEAGCELSLDYLINNPGGASWPCRCGAQRCRGETSNSFFTLPTEVQQEYAPLLASWFVDRYREELKHLGGSAGRPTSR